MKIQNQKPHQIKVKCIVISKEPYYHLSVSAKRKVSIRVEIPDLVPNQSKLLQPSPILDKSLIKVGGHFNHANIPKQSKHQIIIPANRHVTSLMFKHYGVVFVCSTTSFC